MAPAEGAALVCSNHQSYMDPVLIGAALRRRLNYLARDTLFDFGPFRWLIRWYDAIPIRRDGFGLAGIKATLRRLKDGEAVLLFPEGARTRDGEVSPLRPGFCTLARRGKAALVPVGIDGAFDAWPRWQRLPRTEVIHIHVGQPIPAEAVRTMTDAELVEELERRIRLCHARAREGRRRRRPLNRSA